jgi:hypothetical protein
VGTAGRNDTYGYAFAAQPDQSQVRPTTNTGSQPTEQEPPAYTRSPKGPYSGRSHCTRGWRSRANRTTRGLSRHFIPDTDAIDFLNARYRRAVRVRGHFPKEQAALKCLYLTTRSLDPTGQGMG